MEFNKRKACSVCAVVIENIKRCSKCQIRFYCSKECQVKDWKEGHKDNCKPLTTENIILKDMNSRLQDSGLVHFQHLIRNSINSLNGEKIRYLVIFFVEEEGKAIDNLTDIYFGVTDMDRKNFLKTVSKNLIDLGREAMLAIPENIPYISVRFIGKSSLKENKGLKLSHIANGSNYLWTNDIPKGNIGSSVVSRDYHISKDIKDISELKPEKIPSQKEYRTTFNNAMKQLDLTIEDFENGKYYLLYKSGTVKKIPIEENPHIPEIIKLELGKIMEFKL